MVAEGVAEGQIAEYKTRYGAGFEDIKRVADDYGHNTG